MFAANSKCVGVLAFVCLFIPNVHAVEQWKQAYERGAWDIETNSFECRIIQKIAGVATVSVIREPEDETAVVLQLDHPDAKVTSPSVSIQHADWKANADVPMPILSKSQFTDSKAKFYGVGSDVLAGIAAGDWLSFSYLQQQQPKNIVFTSTHGADAVVSFRQCLAQMAPISWNTARESVFYFDTGKSSIDTNKDLQMLQHIVRYISLDENVTKVLIDGYTDSVGNNTANRVLSQQRADDVAARLVEYGMESSLLEVRAHGSRYPIVNNQDVNKNLNRRVTVRLIRKNNVVKK